MRYLKFTYLFLGLLLGFLSCTEIYYPEINSGTEALVVEGLITNEAGPFTIKLSKAKPLPYDSIGEIRYTVKGAKVSITDNENKTYNLTETSGGNYTTPDNFIPKTGNSYKLHIRTKDGYMYESNSEKLLPAENYDSIRATTLIKNYVNSKSEVENILGAEVVLDLFNGHKTTDSIPGCRFYPELTYQYWYTYRDRDINGNEIMTYHWANFGWRNYNLNTNVNLTDEKNPSLNPTLKNHSIGFIPYDPWSYALIISEPTLIFYVRLNQYTLNHDSYRFYKSANNQLSASGKIFDPINSQLYGNMKCLNGPSKIVLGLFEVSSVNKKAFVLNLRNHNQVVTVIDCNYLNIPENSDFQYKVWDAMGGEPTNDPTLTPIPLPDWWYHK